jgi:hypothetical protein
MEFLADENVPRPIIERLRKDGLTVRSIFEGSRGVLLLELARLPLREQVERVATFLASGPKDLTGNLTVIEPARARVRALPSVRK